MTQQHNTTDGTTSVDLTAFTTFQTTAFAQDLLIINKRSDLNTLTDRLGSRSFIVIGGGSNVLFADDYNGVVIVNRLRGIEIIEESTQNARIKIAAGENWHDVVIKLSQQGLYGLENLALIPGTMGAAPVQNIGAYGVEIANFIDSVEVFDLRTKTFNHLSPNDCDFSYRNSKFKTNEWRQRYIIVSVTLCLSKTFAPILSYQGLCQPDSPTTAQQLLQRVIDVRQSKLPDPAVLANAGSFFQNPIISRVQLQKLQAKYRDIPYFDIDNDKVKIPAAWLIEQAGFKGHQQQNGAGVYDKHALILVNHGKAHGKEIYALAREIMTSIKDKFAIDISPEVRIIGTITQ
ncbi:MAG: UDP-N-acetylenolpyruvoylglucosamine reductase [Cardiobacteriales bacterium]|nr:MAG: UDP-N-acetylenolpyruvoylglucosamine reductase [Gammaproteobacteria bacterium]PIE82184.1 MAG: UDP-N-acetylenolpyruvoylglucosamine reductase [Cardiobacteriales bacterium]